MARASRAPRWTGPTPLLDLLPCWSAGGGAVDHVEGQAAHGAPAAWAQATKGPLTWAVGSPADPSSLGVSTHPSTSRAQGPTGSRSQRLATEPQLSRPHRSAPP